MKPYKDKVHLSEEEVEKFLSVDIPSDNESCDLEDDFEDLNDDLPIYIEQDISGVDFILDPQLNNESSCSQSSSAQSSSAKSSSAQSSSAQSSSPQSSSPQPSISSDPSLPIVIEISTEVNNDDLYSIPVSTYSSTSLAPPNSSQSLPALKEKKKKQSTKPSTRRIKTVQQKEAAFPSPAFSTPTWDKDNVNLVQTDRQFSQDNPTGISSKIRDIEQPTPYKLFNQLFSDELLEHLVFQTNLYMTQKALQPRPPKRARSEAEEEEDDDDDEDENGNKKITPTTIEELKLFLGINLYMGIKKLPSYRDYWSTQPDLHDNLVSSLMPVKRFSQLLSHLHVNDNEMMPKRGDPDHDKLYKIRPMLDILSKTFSDSYNPHECVAVDESMVKFKGRCFMKQFMRDKPIKRGYKIWMMCDSSGYNLKFEIYTGKLKDSVEMGLGERVVSQFCSSLAGKNHIVVMDNFFTSYPLFLRLKENSISACGTVNQARKHLPKLTDDKLLKRGEFDWSVSNHGISVYKWKDNKCVNLMSNYHNPNDTLSVQRREKDGTKISVPCPKILPDYNGNMNFVDNFDRLKGDYCIDRKSKKWWPRLFYHFLDCCVINAFIMHKELNMQQLSNKDFRRNIYMDMFSSKLREKIGAEKPLPKPVLSVVERRQHKPFVPANIRLEENKHRARRGSSRRCAKCSTLKKPVRTIWFCITCNVPLCQRKDKPCFDDWHSK